MSFGTTPPRNDYIGNGAVSQYGFGFKIFAATDLRVRKRVTGATTDTVLVYPTDFTVPTGDIQNENGGTITLTAGNLPSGARLSIRFFRTTQQDTDLRNQGGFFPETHEDAFDKIVRFVQQNEDAVNRSLRLPETEVGTDAATLLPAAADRASKFLAFDAAGNPLPSGGGLSSPPVSAFMTTVLDDLSAAVARATLGVEIPINDMTAVTAEAADYVGIADVSAGGTSRKALISDIVALVPSSFTTGDVKLTLKTTADAGWVLMNDGTIGNAASGGTSRANADTVDLFTLLWNNTANADCAVSGGRGGSAAADYAANKTLALPKALGRALACYGSGSGLTARTLAHTVGAETHVLTIPEMPSHDHPNGFTGGATFGAGGGGAGASTGFTGGGGSHNNMQPTVFLNVMIKL